MEKGVIQMDGNHLYKMKHQIVSELLFNLTHSFNTFFLKTLFVFENLSHFKHWQKNSRKAYSCD